MSTIQFERSLYSNQLATDIEAAVASDIVFVVIRDAVPVIEITFSAKHFRAVCQVIRKHQPNAKIIQVLQ